MHEGNGKLALFLSDEDKHIMLTILSWSHAYDLDFLSGFQG
jgi:hypothetical protein